MSCDYFSNLVRLGRQLSLFRVEATRAAGGVKHTLVCTSDGDLYTFGAGANGMLGHAGDNNEALPRVVEVSHTRAMPHAPLDPWCHHPHCCWWQALSAVHVTGVAAGNMHSIVMTKQGGCYAFGHAWYGRLGISPIDR